MPADTETETDVETETETDTETEVDTDTDYVETETKTYVIEIENATVKDAITENSKGPSDGASGGYYYIGENGFAYTTFVPEYTGLYTFTVKPFAHVPGNTTI